MSRLAHRVASLTVVAGLASAALTGCGSPTSSTDAGSPSRFTSTGPGGIQVDPALQKPFWLETRRD